MAGQTIGCGKTKNSPQVLKLAGRPADCLGLTKRWSLYVASTATPGFLTDLRQAKSILIHR